LIRSWVATVVVVAGSVVATIVVVEVELGGDVVLTTVVSATLVAADTGAVDGADDSSLLHPATASAAKPKASSRFKVCTHRLRSASWTLPPSPVV